MLFNSILKEQRGYLTRIQPRAEGGLNMEEDLIKKRYFSDNERFADLINGYGFEGRQIGDILSRLLELVLDQEIPNEKAALLSYAQSRS